MDGVDYVFFKTTDTTFWTMSVKPVNTEDDGYGIKLILAQENYHEQRYILNVEVSSANKHSDKVFMGPISLDLYKAKHVFPFSELATIFNNGAARNVLYETFRFKVKIRCVEYVENIPVPDDFLQNKEFRKQLYSLVLSRRFADVIIDSGTYCFTLHRCILSVRSGFFLDLLKDENCHYPDNVANQRIDLPADEFIYMYSYIYSGKCRRMSALMTVRMYIAAKMYKLSQFQRLCFDILKNAITVTTACQMLELADDFEIAELKEECKAFMNNNIELVQKMDPNWPRLKPKLSKLFRRQDSPKQ